MSHHLGYAKHDYQGKADKEALDEFINHHTDDDLLDDEQPSAEEGGIWEFGLYCTLRNFVEYHTIIDLRDNGTNLWKTLVLHRVIYFLNLLPVYRLSDIYQNQYNQTA